MAFLQARGACMRLDKTQRRFLAGAVLGLAFFLIEAGVVEILLAMDDACRLQVSRLRLPTDPFAVCMAEWKWYLLRAISRGILWDGSPLASWLIMGGFYGLVGGLSAQFFRRRGIVVFLLAQAAVVAFLAGLGYVRQFVG